MTVAEVNDRGFAKLKVPIGPSHPALEEPARFLFDVEGEKVVDVDYEIGYNHRSIERLCQERPFSKIVYLVERICGICSHAHPLNHVERVEDIADIEVPARANTYGRFTQSSSGFTRTCCGRNAGEEIGYHTLLMSTWREREKVMDLFEMLSGNRVMHGCNQIGGVKWNISDEQARSALGVLRLSRHRCRQDHQISSKGQQHRRTMQGRRLPKQRGRDPFRGGGPERTCERRCRRHARYVQVRSVQRFDLEPQIAKDGDVVAQALVPLARTQTIHWAHQGAYSEPA